MVVIEIGDGKKDRLASTYGQQGRSTKETRHIVMPAFQCALER